MLGRLLLLLLELLLLEDDDLELKKEPPEFVLRMLGLPPLPPPPNVLKALDMDRCKVGRSLSDFFWSFGADGSIYLRFELHTSRPESRQ